jgi:glutamate-1-semialdehyde aminotransferase
VAAAIATLHTLAAAGTFQRMHAHGMRLRRALEEAAGQHGVQLVTTGVGSVFSLHFGMSKPPRTCRDAAAADMQHYGRFRAAMLEAGIHLLTDGRWYVGATHTDRELEIALSAIDRCLVGENA